MPEELVVRVVANDEIDQMTEELSFARLYQQNGEYVVAFSAHRPVGHAYLTSTQPPEIQNVEVVASWRRRGVARLLFTFAEQRARGRGDLTLRLTVSQEQPETVAMYGAMGYVDSGVPPIRVLGTVQIRTGPLAVDDTLLTLEKRLA